MNSLARTRNFFAAALVATFAATTTFAVAQEAHPQQQGGDTAASEHNAPAAAQHGSAPGVQPGGQTQHGVPAAAHGGDTGTAQSGEHRADAEGEHGAAEHGGEHAGAHHGPEAINWTDIFDKKRPAILALVINFGVLVTLYYMLGKKPITAALKQRRVTIGKDIDEAQALLDEAKELAKTYQAELKSADVNAATAKATLIAAGKGEVEHLLVEAKERADRMKRDADRLVEQERKQVHLDILNETVDLAVREAAQLLEKSVTADDHVRLAQDLLAELSRRPAAAKSAGSTSGGAT